MIFQSQIIQLLNYFSEPTISNARRSWAALCLVLVLTPASWVMASRPFIGRFGAWMAAASRFKLCLKGRQTR